MDTYTIIEFCAGTGMLSTGVEIAFDVLGLRAHTICYVEREASAAASLLARMEAAGIHDTACWDDAESFDAAAWRGTADIFCAGYPCQPFSQCGRRAGEKDSRHLWPVILEKIAEIKPSIVYLENVAGHLTLGFDAVCRDLEGLNFRVTPGLFSSQEAGASHRRERLFIMGNATSIDGKKRKVRRAGIRTARMSRGELADVPGERLRETRRGSGNSTNGLAGSSGKLGKRELPRYALARNDFDGWNVVAELDASRMPAIESEIRGVVDGLAPWAEQLRLIGNGVDPLAAGYAFIALSACAQRDSGNAE